MQLFCFCVFLPSYFSSKDDHTGVGVIERDEGRGGDVYMGAGYGSRGQGVSRVQVESSLTATEGQKEKSQRWASLWLTHCCPDNTDSGGEINKISAYLCRQTFLMTPLLNIFIYGYILACNMTQTTFVIQLTCQILTPTGICPHTPKPHELPCGPQDLDPPENRKCVWLTKIKLVTDTKKIS